MFKRSMLMVLVLLAGCGDDEGGEAIFPQEPPPTTPTVPRTQKTLWQEGDSMVFEATFPDGATANCVAIAGTGLWCVGRNAR